MAQRKFCTNCKYPMLLLSHFEGASSLDAPRPTASGDYGYGLKWIFISQLALPWFLLCNLWRSGKRRKRREQVIELKRRVLPVDPEAQVCPLCLHIEHSFVKL